MIGPPPRLFHQQTCFAVLFCCFFNGSEIIPLILLLQFKTDNFIQDAINGRHRYLLGSWLLVVSFQTHGILQCPSLPLRGLVIHG